MNRYGKIALIVGAAAAASIVAYCVAKSPKPVEANASAGTGSVDDDLVAVLDEDTNVEYKIHAFRIGFSAEAPRDPFIKDPTMQKKIPVSFGMWLIEGEGRLILVDTGFVHKGMIEKWQVEDYQSPTEALASAGFTPDQITDVIVTHKHWDHTGGLAFFKKATIWITDTALEALENNGPLKSYFAKADEENRVRINSHLIKITPGVVALKVGLHTPGNQIVAVNNKGKRWILVIDTAPLYANFERKKPTGQTDNPKRTLALQQKILNWVDGDLHRIVPGHELSLFHGKRHIVLTNSTR